MIDKITESDNNEILGAKFSVCIATYKRPSNLRNLIFSIEKQCLPEGGNIEIIIVDNDPEESARVVIDDIKESFKIPILYFHQSIKNISLTRNVAVKNASGDFLLFIDDDEYADNEWVINLYSALKKYNADGVFGLVIPEFENNAPEWIRNKEFYYSPVDKTGSRARYTYTSNCLINAKLLKQFDVPFNVNFGLTGGEDAELFDRLQKEGANFITCTDGIVYEHIPADRATLSYIFIRFFKGGNSHTWRLIERSTFFNKINLIVSMTIKSLFYGIMSIVLMIFYVFNKKHCVYWLLKLGSNLGRFSAAVGWHYKGYK
ncbi:MAG: glycosyltransferase family 2 protein [Candidatus Kariarchaeaceae archaeon]|jgi:succinoglycan biosynthesis protein ExoM